MAEHADLSGRVGFRLDVERLDDGDQRGLLCPHATVLSKWLPVGRGRGLTALVGALVSAVVAPSVTGAPSWSTWPGQAKTRVVGAAGVPV